MSWASVSSVLRSAWSAVGRCVGQQYERVRCAWVMVLATWRVVVLQRYLCDQDFWVYKAVAINEDENKCQVVTKTFEPQHWEDATRQVTGWQGPFRVDVRYLAHGRKFRMVLHPGDTFTFPPVPESHRGGPKGIMAAELVGTGLYAPNCNVTSRVLKYQGPAKDFHRGMGLKVALTEMFPYRDPQALQEDYNQLKVVDACDACAQEFCIPVNCDDVGKAMAAHTKAD